MIIVKIKAGLGNQLFQYAFGRALSLRNGDPLLLDITSFDTDQFRKYGLDHFNISGRPASQNEINRIRYPLGIVSIIATKAVNKARSKFNFLNTFDSSYVGFHPEMMRKKNVYLDGYWQSELYFKDFADVIRKDLTPKTLSTRAQEILDTITQDPHAVSLHIRRGDNANNPASMERFGTPPTSYYREAMKRIISMNSRAHFYVFSDDVEWVRTNIRSEQSMTIVSQPAVEDWEEICLMRACRDHIIANSTFSWWGAWLNDRPQKTVIAPTHWARQYQELHKDVIPSEWIRI